MTAEQIRAEVDKIWWWHTMDLGHGIVTPGRDPTPSKLRHILLPDSFRGKSVLDVCAWDGFFSFEAERRGAARVMAVDHFVWSRQSPWGSQGEWSKAGFDFARRVLDSKVEDRHVDVLDVSPETVGGEYDVVLFLGVLYHMRHPLLALEKVASVTRDMLILETHVDLTSIGRPAMAFYPTNELCSDPTNWFGPNEAAVIGMLKAVGFRNAECVDRFNPDPPATLEVIPPLSRATFHAWK
jgi:tRNA (mo5U34)-methyltransferase